MSDLTVRCPLCGMQLLATGEGMTEIGLPANVGHLIVMHKRTKAEAEKLVEAV